MKIKNTFYKKGNLVVVVYKEAMEKAPDYEVYMEEYQGEELLDDILEHIAQVLDIIIVEEGQEHTINV